MLIKIDTNSQEFQGELAKTINFTDKVCKQFNFVYNLESEINDSVKLGLTRNKLIYGKRYCPCFMVVGQTDEERKASDNRICPCEPALKEEIPADGHCHCGIFCTPQYVAKQGIQNSAVEVSHTHSRGLTKEECELLLGKEFVDGDELEALIEARNIGFVDFVLVDTREWMENKSKMIVGTDFLVPTTSFYQAISQIEDKKNQNIIVYCFSGSRSAYCQQMMKQMGYRHVVNLEYGIMSYKGETARGK